MTREGKSEGEREREREREREKVKQGSWLDISLLYTVHVCVHVTCMSIVYTCTYCIHVQCICVKLQKKEELCHKNYTLTCIITRVCHYVYIHVHVY